jgi:hypothetical protein
MVFRRRAGEADMKKAVAESAGLKVKMDEAREMCLARLRMIPRSRRESVADALLALADPEWWDLRHKGSEVFLLILELRKDKAMKIMRDAQQ